MTVGQAVLIQPVILIALLGLGMVLHRQVNWLFSWIDGLPMPVLGLGFFTLACVFGLLLWLDPP